MRSKLQINVAMALIFLALGVTVTSNNRDQGYLFFEWTRASTVVAKSFDATARSRVEQMRADSTVALNGNCVHPTAPPRGTYSIINLNHYAIPATIENAAFKRPSPPECKPSTGAAPDSGSRFLVRPRLFTRSRMT